MGKTFSDLHAVVHAWQPIQRVWSMTLAHWTGVFRAGSGSIILFELKRARIYHEHERRTSDFFCDFITLRLCVKNEPSRMHFTQGGKKVQRHKEESCRPFRAPSAIASELICAILAVAVRFRI